VTVDYCVEFPLLSTWIYQSCDIYPPIGSTLPGRLVKARLRVLHFESSPCNLEARACQNASSLHMDHPQKMDMYCLPSNGAGMA
jgi:hypothetical protein